MFSTVHTVRVAVLFLFVIYDVRFAERDHLQKNKRQKYELSIKAELIFH